MSSTIAHLPSLDGGGARQTDDAPAARAVREHDDLATLEDAVLLARFQKGEIDAFTELYRRHSAAVRAVCRRRLRDDDLAEEAVQETFMKALRGLGTFQPDAPVERWLCRVAKNHCIDVLRRRTPEALEETAPVHLADRRAESAFDHVLTRSLLAEVMEQLKERDRELLISHHVHGVPVEGLARVWDMTTGAMAVALHRARSRARIHASAEGWSAVPLLVWWRSRRTVTTRPWVPADPVGSVVQAIGHVLVGAVLAGSAIMSTSPAQASHLPTAPTDAPAAVSNSEDPPPSSGDDGTAPGHPIEDDSGAKPPTETRGPSATATEEAQPVAQVPPVEVPETVRVDQQPPDAPRDYRYGARAEVGESSAEWWVETYDMDEAADAGELACDVAAAGEPVTYCEG